MVTIVDYGLGNVQAFLNVYKRLNIPAKRATTVADLSDATRIILPGVGAFDHAMERLEKSGMRAKLEELVIQKGIPVLGVCVGMQILGDRSDEGKLPGLGWIEGNVRQFDSNAAINLPHMGWNDVRPARPTPLLRDLENDSRFYFLHSFYFDCAQAEDVAAVSAYGGEFSSVISRGNVHGVQFHPEKSHHFGIRLLSNFATT
jgi:glutamine amidotransferase